MTETTEAVWNGPEQLRPFLVPIGDLEPFPGNPRVGSVDDVAASFVRFGQLKPIVVDGARIVAGHHMVRACEQLGWTHIAALDHRFVDEDEQRAFLLADNRTSELGSTDTERLVAQLSQLAEIDALQGTGYTTDDLDGYLAELARLNDFTPPSFEASAPGPSDLREVVLFYNPEQHQRFERWLGIVAREKAPAAASPRRYSRLSSSPPGT